MDGIDINADGFDLDAALGADFEDAPDTTTSDTPETQQGEAQAADTTAAPAPDAAQAATETQQPEGFKPEGPGDLRVALHQERQQRQALTHQLDAQQQQMAQLMAYLQQAQQPEPQVPDADLEPEAYRQWEIQQAVAPLQQQMAQMQAFYRQQANEAQLTALEAQHPGARELVGKVAQLPALQGFDPQAQYYFAIGAQWANPEAREALIKPLVDARVQAALQQLKPQKPTAPASLGNLPAASAQDGALTGPPTAADFQKHGLGMLDLL